MNRLETSYLGLKLKNPLIVASSPLTRDIDSLKKAEDSNVAAVVLPSLFEEDINFLTQKTLTNSSVDYARGDAYDYISVHSKNFHIDKYLELVEKAKKSLSIPVIASVNCSAAGSWSEYIKSISDLNVDAIEVNHFLLPSDWRKDNDFYMDAYFDILKDIRANTKLPIALKLGAYFTDMAKTLRRFSNLDIQGLILFNRYFRTDIDIQKTSFKSASPYSNAQEMYIPLLWTALSSGELDCDICGNTGIDSAESIVKFILSGAKAVQLCSILMKNGISYAKEILNDLEKYYQEKNTSVEKTLGILAQESIDNPKIWERAQYVKAHH